MKDSNFQVFTLHDVLCDIYKYSAVVFRMSQLVFPFLSASFPPFGKTKCEMHSASTYSSFKESSIYCDMHMSVQLNANDKHRKRPNANYKHKENRDDLT
jgi:hypothetical protein